jgi:hypothetical protein
MICFRWLRNVAIMSLPARTPTQPLRDSEAPSTVMTQSHFLPSCTLCRHAPWLTPVALLSACVRVGHSIPPRGFPPSPKIRLTRGRSGSDADPSATPALALRGKRVSRSAGVRATDSGTEGGATALVSELGRSRRLPLARAPAMATVLTKFSIFLAVFGENRSV